MIFIIFNEWTVIVYKCLFILIYIQKTYVKYSEGYLCALSIHLGLSHGRILY